MKHRHNRDETVLDRNTKAVVEADFLAAAQVACEDGQVMNVTATTTTVIKQKANDTNAIGLTRMTILTESKCENACFR